MILQKIKQEIELLKYARIMVLKEFSGALLWEN
jgi:hypothetical protein